MSWYPKGRFFRSALFPLIAIVILVFVASQALAGCGQEEASGPGCVGPITEKYTEYKPGIGISSGNLTIPTGKTVYSVIIEKSDGTFCTKSMKKEQWVQTQVGDTYGTT